MERERAGQEGGKGGGVDFTWGWWLHREKRRRGRYEFRTGIGTAGYLWLYDAAASRFLAIRATRFVHRVSAGPISY